MDVGLVVGVIVIGLIHGVLPDHGWPIAAMYGLSRSRRWFAGAFAALVLGVGHLISSVALVLAYFWFSSFARFAEGPWLRYIAGGMLILLGVYEYRYGGHGGSHHHHDDNHHHGDHGHDHGDHGDHNHDHGDNHHHSHDDHHGGHSHDDHQDHDHSHTSGDSTDSGVISRVRSYLPGGGGHRHLDESDAERGLFALGTTALVLGFAHEEPIQILAICVGTEFCLELMLVYSLAVIFAILVPTLVLIAGYERHKETVEAYTPYLPTLTAVVLVGMGLAFILGVF